MAANGGEREGGGLAKLAGAAGWGLNLERLGSDGGSRRCTGGCLLGGAGLHLLGWTRLYDGDCGHGFEGEQRLSFEFGVGVFLKGEVLPAGLADCGGWNGLDGSRSLLADRGWNVFAGYGGREGVDFGAGDRVGLDGADQGAVFADPTRQHGFGVIADPLIEQSSDLAPQVGGVIQTRQLKALQRRDRCIVEEIPRWCR
jgi:hypothetical protein